jgi:hypothetical protein
VPQGLFDHKVDGTGLTKTQTRDDSCCVGVSLGEEKWDCVEELEPLSTHSYTNCLHGQSLSMKKKCNDPSPSQNRRRRQHPKMTGCIEAEHEAAVDSQRSGPMSTDCI